MRRNISLNLYIFSEREQFISQTFTYLKHFAFHFPFCIRDCNRTKIFEHGKCN